LRRLFRLIPKLVRQLDALESALPKLEAMEPILVKIGDLDSKVSALEVLGNTAPKLDQLNMALEKIHSLQVPVAVQAVVLPEHKNGKAAPDHEWNRLKLLSKFVNLVGKARDIEKEWQRIQQDEHDEHFAFQVLRGNNEASYLYKKGIADGIKWCVDRFS
jgi:hypothetical protein